MILYICSDMLYSRHRKKKVDILKKNNDSVLIKVELVVSKTERFKWNLLK